MFYFVKKYQKMFIIVRFMIHIVCYNKNTEMISLKTKNQNSTDKKENKIMPRNIRKNENEMMDMRLVSDNCNCSIYTMGAVAAGILFCLGIVLYALLAA